MSDRDIIGIGSGVVVILWALLVVLIAIWGREE